MTARIALVTLLVACSAGETAPPPENGGGQAGASQGGTSQPGGAGQGAGQGGSTSGSAGTPAAGTSSGTSGASGAPAGGAAGNAGAGGANAGGASGASGAGGSGSGAAGSAGVGGAAGGAGGTAGASGAGGAGNAGGSGGGANAAPSAGCEKMTPRPANGVVTVANERIYTFPASYDGRTPFPLMLGFHANGNPINQIQNLTNGSALETDFVRAFPKSAGSGWNYNTDISRVRAMWDDLLENYCIDTNRIFGTGHSSGAQMIVQMLCNGETRFRGVAPVAASKYCNSFAPVAVLYIQGQMDAQRGNGNGADVVDVFRSSNDCESTNTPKTDVEMCRSSLDNAPVSSGCIAYDGCSVPTLWCSHNDNSYNTTDGRQHGWPCFASSTIGAFFQTLD